jgi:uncharacterized protein YukE
MDSEELSQLAERMKASIRKISAASDRVLSKVNRLSTKWYGGTADHFIDQANDHLDSFSGTINQLDTLRFQLLVEIDQWLNADLNDSYQIRSAIHAAITSPSGSTIPGYEYEMDKIIRDADVDGKEFLWRGIMISATGGSFAGLGAAGLYKFTEWLRTGLYLRAGLPPKHRKLSKASGPSMKKISVLPRPLFFPVRRDPKPLG